MNLKTVEIDGAVYAEVQDGMPVYEAEDGKASPFNAVQAVAAIKSRNAEAKTYREAKEQAEARLKAFEGFDPDAARKAMEIVRNLDDKKLIDAGEVEKVRSEAKAAFERQFNETYKPLEAERNQLKAQLYNERLSTAFSRSKYIAEKVETPLDLIQARFGPNFTIEDDGKFVAKGYDGNPLFSHANPGSPPDFEEAIEMLIAAHPDRDRMLRGSGASGGGASGRSGANGRRQVTRDQLRAMPPEERAKVSRESEIVD